MIRILHNRRDIVTIYAARWVMRTTQRRTFVSDIHRPRARPSFRREGDIPHAVDDTLIFDDARARTARDAEER